MTDRDITKSGPTKLTLIRGGNNDDGTGQLPPNDPPNKLPPSPDLHSEQVLLCGIVGLSRELCTRILLGEKVGGEIEDPHGSLIREGEDPGLYDGQRLELFACGLLSMVDSLHEKLRMI